MAEDKNIKKKGFIKGMKSELKKVIWPTGEQTVKSTFATIAFVILVSLVLIVFNLLFNALSNLWIKSLSNEDVIENILGSGEAISGEVMNEEETITPEIVNEVPSEEIAEPVVETSGE